MFVVIHTVKSFSIINKAEVDVFLELSCFFDDTMDVGNLVSLKQGGKKFVCALLKELLSEGKPDHILSELIP